MFFIKLYIYDEKKNNRANIRQTGRNISISGLAGRCRCRCRKKNNINLMIFTGNTPGPKHTYQLNYEILQNIITNNRIDGLIIMTGVLNDYMSADKVSSFCSSFTSIPIAAISTAVDYYPGVFIDNISGMKQIVSHLITEHNLTKIAFVKGPDGHPEAEDRLCAYKQILEENNIVINDNLIIDGNFTPTAGYQAVEKLTGNKEVEVEAIVTADDDTAVGVIDALHEKNINVPFEIAITGFDNAKEAEYLFPPLTTVEQPLFEQGRKSLEMVLSMLNGSKVESLILPTHILVRQSCGCLSESI